MEEDRERERERRGNVVAIVTIWWVFTASPVAFISSYWAPCLSSSHPTLTLSLLFISLVPFLHLSLSPHLHLVPISLSPSLALSFHAACPASFWTQSGTSISVFCDVRQFFSFFLFKSLCLDRLICLNTSRFRPFWRWGWEETLLERFTSCHPGPAKLFSPITVLTVFCVCVCEIFQQTEHRSVFPMADSMHFLFSSLSAVALVNSQQSLNQPENTWSQC